MSYKRILKWSAVCMGVLLFISIALYVYGSKKKLKEEEKLKLEEIAEKQAKGMKMEQLIDALLLMARNDTNAVSYALVIPKATLVRLARKESKPTSYALEKFRKLFIYTNAYGIDFLYSCADYKKDKKEGLLNGEQQLLINELWEEHWFEL